MPPFFVRGRPNSVGRMVVWGGIWFRHGGGTRQGTQGERDENFSAIQERGTSLDQGAGVKRPNLSAKRNFVGSGACVS